MKQISNPTDYPLVAEITSSQNSDFSLCVHAMDSSLNQCYSPPKDPDTFCFRYLLFLKATDPANLAAFCQLVSPGSPAKILAENYVLLTSFAGDPSLFPLHLSGFTSYLQRGGWEIDSDFSKRLHDVIYKHIDSDSRCFRPLAKPVQAKPLENTKA